MVSNFAKGVQGQKEPGEQRGAVNETVKGLERKLKRSLECLNPEDRANQDGH